MNESITWQKALVRRFAAMLDSGDLAEFDCLVTPDFTLKTPMLQSPMSRAAVRSAIGEVCECFSESTHVIDALVQEGDVVVARYAISGRQVADYQGIPSTGARFTIAGVSIYRFAEGLICEEWELVDRSSLVKQLVAKP